MPTTSSTWIQGMYWLPPATGPPTPGGGAADPEAEERQHLGQRAAAAVEHDAGAHLGHAQPEPARTVRLALPGDADPGQEVAAGRRVLVERLVAVRAVVADGRGGHEHARARRGRLQAGDEVAGAELARGADPALGVLAPPLRDVLAREVHDRVAAGQRLGRRRLLLGAPGDGVARGGAARERGDRVAAGAQALDELRADQAAGAGDGDVHGGGTGRWGCCLTPGRLPPPVWRPR